MGAKYNLKVLCNNSEQVWKQLRWAPTNGVVICPICGCPEIYHLSDGRYKCKHCRKVFSDKTGTILHGSKVPVWVWLVAMYKFSVCKEFSAIDLTKMCSISYPTSYMILQKLRYVSGLDKCLMSGIVRMDELYLGGWSNMHFRKKIEFMKKNGFMDPNSTRYDKTKILRASSAKKFHTISIVDENNRTKLIHCPNPITKEIVSILLKEGNITGIISDESKLYEHQGIPVFQSNHSKHIFMTPEGFSSNAVETRFSWVSRKWSGTFSHTSEKYLQLYLNQRQWSFNHTGMNQDKVFISFVGLCINNRVKDSDIRNFDYKRRFPRSRREVQEEQMRSIMSSCGGLVASVTDSYGRTFRN